MEIPSTGPGAALPVSGGGGWVATTVGSQDLTIDGFTADLAMTKADDLTAALAVNCVANVPETVVGTVEVTEVTVQSAARTTTKAKAKFNKKNKKATVAVTVKAKGVPKVNAPILGKVGCPVSEVMRSRRRVVSVTRCYASVALRSAHDS